MTATPAIAASPSVEITDFGRVETLSWGEGPRTLVMLHASATGPHAFAPLAARLAARGWRCVAPALHGYGESRVEVSTNPLDGHRTIARHAIESSGARVVFGHSMGGLAAVLCCAGLDLDRLVLFEPILFAALAPEADAALIEVERAMHGDMSRHLAAGDVEAAVRVFVEPWNDAAWSDLPDGVRRRLIEQAPAIVAETLAIGAAAGAATIPDTLWAGAPTTVLMHGDRSPEIARRMAARAADRFANARTVALDGIGHMGPLTAPARLADAILAAVQAAVVP